MKKEEGPMTESGVHQIVFNAFDKYEHDTALPRHKENVARLTDLITNMDDLNRTMDKIDGGVTAIKHVLRYLGGSLTTLYILIKLIQALKGHL
jgi:hypothetical protein